MALPPVPPANVPLPSQVNWLLKLYPCLIGQALLLIVEGLVGGGKAPMAFQMPLKP